MKKEEYYCDICNKKQGFWSINHQLTIFKFKIHSMRDASDILEDLEICSTCEREILNKIKELEVKAKK